MKKRDNLSVCCTAAVQLLLTCKSMNVPVLSVRYANYNKNENNS